MKTNVLDLDQTWKDLEDVTLMTGTLGLNRDDSWFRTSARSCWCFRTFLIFMILTMAA